jgi:probable HAF family extracellular repeat protein
VITRFRHLILLLCLFASVTSFALAAGPYTFTSYVDPLSTGIFQPSGINNSGQIVGLYGDANGAHGFLYSGTAFTTIDYPSSLGTFAAGINNKGQIVGTYWDQAAVSHGYIYGNGTFTIIDAPMASGTPPACNVGGRMLPCYATGALGLNDLGQVVGVYYSGGMLHGFLYSNGSFTTLDDPLATNGGTGTIPAGINNGGRISGFYNGGGTNHGFLYNNGSFTTIDDPASTGCCGFSSYTVLQGINNEGQAVGYFIDGAGLHGFLYSGGQFTTLDDPSATAQTLYTCCAVVTFAVGINDAGKVVGEYVANNIEYGYIASPPVTITEFPVPSSGSRPFGITRGTDGNIWFVEEGQNCVASGFGSDKIGKINSNGVVTEFAVPTTGACPAGIARGPDGNMWFTEQGGNKIGRVTPAGGITEFPVPTPGSGPLNLTIGPDGNLWFTEYYGNKIARITTAGAVTEFSIPSPNSHPDTITMGPDGNLWFTEADFTGNKVARVTSAGVITEFLLPTPNAVPRSIVTGPDGNLWFAEQYGNKIGKITPAGLITEYPVPTSASQPYGLTAGPDGNLWFVEYNALNQCPDPVRCGLGNNVGKITTAGMITEYPVPTSLSGPIQIVTGPDGNLWFTELLGNNIGRVNIAPSSPTITDLGILSGGTASEAWAVNNLGQVVGQSTALNSGGCTLPGDCGHAFLYSGSALTDLGPQDGPFPYSSVAQGFNDVGRIVGTAQPIGYVYAHAFLWTGGGRIDLGTLGGGGSIAKAINIEGQVTGRSDSSYAGPSDHAYLYSGGVMTDLGTLGGTSSFGYGINDGGLVVGVSETSNTPFPSRAFLYSGGVMNNLGTLGGSSSAASGINSTGQVVGLAQLAGDTSASWSQAHGFMYSAGQMKDLGTLGGSYSAAYGINDAGQIVGESTTAAGGCTLPGNCGHAFLYYGAVMTDLNSLLLPNSGWVLAVGTAINNTGAIVGYGTLNGQQHAFLLTGVLSAIRDTTPPTVTVAFPLSPSGQAGYFKAGQTPVGGTVSASDPSTVTALSCVDSLGGLALGALSGGGTGTASRTLSITGDGVHSISCTATDGAGNSGAAAGSIAGAIVKIDTTPPVITYAGNLGTYTADQTVNITCQATDALSGVATSTCKNITGPAYSFALGNNIFSASATDNAGNSGRGSTSFIVQVTTTSLVNLTNQFVTQPGIANSLTTKLIHGDINAFINEVNAQAGKALTVAQAAILIQLAMAL